MENKLKNFLNDVFEPYGNFPARKDVEQELLANLTEKYRDLKSQGKSDDEAYQLTVDSFGDVSEIMEHVNHDPQPHNEEEKQNLRQTIVDTFKGLVNPISDSRFVATSLMDVDLTDTKLSGSDFSMSAIMDSRFDNAELRDTKFKATALKGASFEGADLTGSHFDTSDVQDVSFKAAILTNAKFRRCALKGAIFTKAVLDNTEFKQSDLGEVVLEDLTLNGTIFDGSSFKKTTFKNSTLINVSFHHSEVKHAIFDGATMDKVTYAILKGMKANLDNVTVE